MCARKFFQNISSLSLNVLLRRTDSTVTVYFFHQSTSHFLNKGIKISAPLLWVYRVYSYMVTLGTTFEIY